MQKNKGGLGRGLSAIFDIETPAATVKSSVSNMEEIDLSKIISNPKQPRSLFDQESLEELADSIRVLGVIQPITVRREGVDSFTIISGERRCRASQLAGLTSIPVYIREVDDQTLHEMAIVENIQRQDLNPIEVALSLQRLIDECNLTHDTLSIRVGKKRSTIANYMRLLKMSLEVQSAVRDGYITMGHAKAMASTPEEHQLSVLKKTVKKELSVRQVEEMVKKITEQKTTSEIVEEEYPESYTRLVEHLENLFTQNISIKRDKRGGGKIVVDFDSDVDIENFISKFEKYTI